MFTLHASAINPGLFFAASGPGGAIGARLAVTFSLDAILAFFFALSDAIAAFAFAIARRISCRHIFHDITLLSKNGLVNV